MVKFMTHAATLSQPPSTSHSLFDLPLSLSPSLLLSPHPFLFHIKDALFMKEASFNKYIGSRESAPTNNRKFTSDKRQQAQGKCAVRARVCGRAFAGARSRARAQPTALV